MLLMIDNYDSFTYNLVQYFQELKQIVTVYYNDHISVPEVLALNPKYVVISPGPGRPEDAGITVSLIKAIAGTNIPTLGVCLGHQAMGLAYGGKVVLADQVMHGKTSAVFHNNQGAFRDIPNSFMATRYHSLLIDQQSLSNDFEITAWTQTDAGDIKEIMGIRHRDYALEGMQFHPESILTEHGHQLLSNFLNMRDMFITNGC
jgi:anthranilate synthase/aminodeoxychorismate synthase-like glutamine amidotransferase